MPIGISDYEHLANTVLKLYADAEISILNGIARRLSKGIASPASWQSKKLAETRYLQVEIRKSLSSLRADRIRLIHNAVQNAYKAGAAGFTAEANAVVQTLGISFVGSNVSKVFAILTELNRSLDASDRHILRRSNDIYASVIANASARIATGTITLRQAVQESLDQFAAEGIRSFTDRSGRKWDMASYAEMATITAIGKATLYGYVDEMVSHGYDLAIVSSHAGSCPICAAWQDVVLSISGRDPDYPSLDEAEGAGLFHPRCLHHLSTYHERLHPHARHAPEPIESPSEQHSVRQIQRRLERSVRTWKRRMAVSVDPYAERYAYAKVRQFQSKLRTLLKDYADEDDFLPRKYWREGAPVRLSPGAKKLKPVTLPAR